MGAGASVSHETAVANRTRLFKILAQEYENLRAKGLSDEEIAAQLEEAIVNDSPEALERMTNAFVSIPYPLRSRILVDYDSLAGHKIITRQDYNLPTSSSSTTPLPHRSNSQKNNIFVYNSNSNSSTVVKSSNTGSPKTASEIRCIEERCQATVEVLRAQQSARILVAVDGSEVAHQAFLTALRLRKGTDVLEVVHVYDPAAIPTLPHQFKPDEVRLKYESELVSRVAVDHYKLTWIDKEDLTTRAVVMNYANQKAFDTVTSGPRIGMLVVGVTGRRGPDDSPQVLGSVADLAFRAVYVPTILVKTALPEEDKQRVFVLAADETERSWNAYLSTLFILRPKDQLIVMHIYEEIGEDSIQDGVDESLTTAKAHVDHIRTRYERDINDRGLVHAEVVNLIKPGGVPLHQAILEFALKREADFIVVAPRLQEQLSSVAEHLIIKGKANVIVVKN